MRSGSAAGPRSLPFLAVEFPFPSGLPSLFMRWIQQWPQQTKKTKKFIRRSLKIFGDRFDYDISFYIKAKLNIKINCRKHGEFKQRVDHHYDGHIGCEECYKESVSDRMKILMNTDEYKSKVFKNVFIKK